MPAEMMIHHPPIDAGARAAIRKLAEAVARLDALTQNCPCDGVKRAEFHAMLKEVGALLG